MAIDAATIDATAASRPVLRERPPERSTASPIINDGHNGRGVEIQGDMSFGDFLDIINPLQHIPIISNIYREITGDTIKPSSKVIGGILYGGPLGGMAAIANAVVEEAQGKDLGDQVMASLGFGGGDHAAPGAAPNTGKTAVAALPDTAALAAATATGAKPASAMPTSPTAAPAAQAAGADKPVRLAAAAQQGAQPTAAGGRDALLAADTPHPTRMPTRDTPLASSMLAKHTAPRFAAPMPGSTTATASALPSAAKASTPGNQPAANQAASPAAANQAAGQGADQATARADAPNPMRPVAPDMLSETMMRNLAKYEQSKRAAQPAAPSLRVSS